MAAQTPFKATYAEYLALEEKADLKHEFHDGEIVAMSGGTPTHAQLQMSVGRAIGGALGQKSCAVFGADLRIRVEATNRAFYPDVTVVCGKLERSQVDKNAVVNPKVVVEILSDSTEAYDRGAKFAHYRRLPSLAEYVLVSQHEALIEVHRKNEAGKWELAVEAREGELAELASLGAAISVDEVYANPLAEG